jgi:glycosidase
VKPLSKRLVSAALLALTAPASEAAAAPAGAAAGFVPAWSQGLVWYEIAPEPFWNGDRANDPRPGSGDLQGIIDRLDLLRDLGIGGIYLMPVFDSPSFHRYDARGYHHVEPTLGPDPAGDRARIAAETPDDPATWRWTQADLLALRLVEAAHARGIRVIFDGPFHNLSVDGFAFRDVVEKGERSRFKDWFTILDYGDAKAGKPIRWKDFMGETIYAAVRRDQAAPNAYTFAATARWMRPVVDGVARPGIDGWRLDLADFIPPAFWKEWTARVRALNPEAFLMGECAKPFDPPEAYVGPSGFSSVMHYRWKAAVERFFVTRAIGARAFGAELSGLLAAYPPEATHALYNLLDSHDTERLVTRILFPEVRKFFDARDFGSADLAGAALKLRRPDAAAYRRLRQIVAFQMTWVGAPAMLYGDEVGMWGAARGFKPMIFADALRDEKGAPRLDDDGQPVRIEAEVLAHFRALIRLRKEHAALRTGAAKILIADDARELLAYARTAGGETLLVVLNVGEKAQTAVLEGATAYRDLLGGARTYTPKDGKLEVPVEAGGWAVLGPAGR